ncbi:MAG: choice-of-anchor J domain-containing protein [Bacteroidales bacterium]|nr:choice-of-anchor J domain-containing protein [Bacteroidales bacterium]
MRKFLFTISLVLIARIACSTELYWQVNPNAFEHSMSVTASIFIDDVEQQNEMLELGAFCGDELRACALPRISTVTDKYIYNITIYGNEDGERLNFKFYDHSTNSLTELVCLQTLEFAVNCFVGDADNPYIVIFTEPNPTFTGNGSWNDASNWENSKVPTEKSIVTIDGDALITDNITVYSLSINETKSLTIKNGGVLTVNETLTNADVNALIIEEGGQLIHHNEGVAATFKNEIVVPTGTWGEEDNTGWQFISSPVENANTADFIPADGDYDLYMYDGTNEYQWQNFKELTTKTYNFSSNPFNNGWTSIDADGDGLSWEYKTRSYMYSVSFDVDTEQDILAENYLVSPQFTIAENTKLRFDAYVDYEEIPETFKVLLSKKSKDNIDDFNVVLEDYSLDNLDAENFEIDLSAYKGESIYIAFYHYVDELGSAQLIIDNVVFENVIVMNDVLFEKGRGYLVSYQNEDNVAEFKGNLNYLAKGESYQIDLNHYPENILAQFNLIGNPFAFDLNWETDVNINNVYDGFATLDATDGGYVYKENGTIKAGEGFMVRTNETGNNYIRFSKASRRSYRAESNSINIIASNNKGSDNVIIRFDDEVKSGFPKLANFNERLANIYVKEENVNYGILNFNTAIDEIPLYFDAKEMGTYTLTFNVKGDYENLYLLDKMTGEELNLLLENEYKFMANASENTERFVLKLTSDTDSVDENFIFINDDELIISSAGTIQIIDMMGRVVMTEENHNGRINIGGLDNAAYVIRCINENGVKVQKIVVL